MTTKAATSDSFYITSYLKEYAKNATASINVGWNDREDIYGFEAVFSYDTEYLECVGYTNVLVGGQECVTQEDGKIYFAYTRVGENADPIGSTATVMQLQFKTKKLGTTSVKLDSIKTISDDYNLNMIEEVNVSYEIKVKNSSSSLSGSSNTILNTTSGTTTDSSDDSLYYISEKVISEDRKAVVSIEVNTEKLLEDAKSATKDNPYQLEITLPEDKLIKQLNSNDVTTLQVNVAVSQSVTSNASIETGDIVIPKQVIETAKNTEKTIVFCVTDENGTVQYEWNFDAKDLKNSKADIKDVIFNLDVVSAQSVQTISEILDKDSSNTSGVVVSFHHSGVLPSQAGVRVYIGKQQGVELNKKVYVYQFNEEKARLDTLKGSYSYKVDKEGYIIINVLSGSDYVILPNQASNKVIKSLLGQIKVTSKYTLAKGQVKTIQISLPDSLEQVASLKYKTASSAIGAAKISYSSNNKSVATVNANKGIVYAKKKGTAEITVKITLYSGKTKEFKVKITVK